MCTYWGRLQSPQLSLEIGSFFPFKVPLVHDRALMDYEMPPYVCLRVRGMAALKQPAKNGPLLAHCGGPGSGRDCAMVMSNWASVIFLVSTFDGNTAWIVVTSGGWTGKLPNIIWVKECEKWVGENQVLSKLDPRKWSFSCFFFLRLMTNVLR